MGRWTKDRIEAWLAETPPDKYQSIPLGHGLRTKGRDRSGSYHAALPGRLDGKTYCDIGCASGAMCFLAEEHGAAQVRGYDKYPRKIEGAIKIGEIKGSAARFAVMDISAAGACAEVEFDVVTCFNVLHHLAHPFLALGRLVKMAREILVVEFILPARRWRKLTGFEVGLAPPLAGVTAKEPGIYLTPNGLEAAVNWFSSDLRLERCEKSPRASDRRIAVFRRET